MTDDLSDLAAALVEEPSAPPPSSPRRAWLAGSMPARRVAIVVAVLLATNAATAALWFRASGSDRARSAVHAVAERFARSLVTFDYRTLDADIKRIQSDATGNFRNELASVLGGGAGVFKDALTGAQAHSSGKVRSVVVTSVGADTATAVVVADQAISNKETPTQTVTRRLHLTLVRTSSGWKVDSVDARDGS